MRRREFISGLGSAAFAWPHSVFARDANKVPRIGYLFSFVASQGQHLWKACRQGLRELGYIEGKNIVLEPRWTEGHIDRLPTLAAELVRLNVDVIVSAATPASRAAKAATSTIPIVFVAVADPIRSGSQLSSAGRKRNWDFTIDPGAQRKATANDSRNRAANFTRGGFDQS